MFQTSLHKKYSVLKNGHVNNSGHKKFTLQQPYFLGEEGQEPGALIYRPQKSERQNTRFGPKI